ncbi:MAG: hypothetical protein H6683_03345 [Deltaproteobacteria bacterium]|nr:hypothetical protein [Deltaproteobacteria bacterium]
MTNAEKNKKFIGHVALWVLALVLAVLPAHGKHARNGWTYDDDALIVGSDWYEQPLSWSFLFEDLGDTLVGRPMGYWRPGLTAMYRLEYALFGKNPAGWHGTGILLHLAGVLLLFAWARVYLRDTYRAGLVAAIFAVHPATAEVAGSINFQTSAVEGACLFAGLLGLAKGRAWIPALATIGAITQRESAMLMPFIFAAIAVIGPEGVTRESARRAARLVAPSFAVVAVYWLLRLMAVDSPVLYAPESYPLGVRVGLIAFLVARTLLLPLPPFLSILHVPTPSLAPILVGYTTIALVVFLGVRLVPQYRQRPGDNARPMALYVATGLSLAPYLGFAAPFVLFAEHYLYVPLALALAFVASALPPPTRAVAVVINAAAAILLGGFAAISFIRADAFVTNDALFNDVGRKYPDSYYAKKLEGEHAYEDGEMEAAAMAFREALSRPGGDRGEIWNALGDVLNHQGRPAAAEECFRRAGPYGEVNLAIVLFNQRKNTDELFGLLNKIEARGTRRQDMHQLLQMTRKARREWTKRKQTPKPAAPTATPRPEDVADGPARPGP